MKKVAIVILNWNRPDDTIKCLKSIGELRIANYELRVIIVDNGSADNSVNQIRKYFSKFPNYQLLTTNSNLGFAGGNNVGIRRALEDGASYVLVLNNDTVIDPLLINQLISSAEKYPRTGIFSPKIYFAPGFEFHKDRYKKSDLGKVIWWAGGKIDWDNVYGENVGVDEVDCGQYDKVREIDFATGACMLVRREVFEKVGLFDEKYFMYLEDADFCIRAERSGFKILFVPEAKLWHKVAQSSGIGSSLNDYFITRNRLLFGMRYASLRTKFALVKESVKFLLSGRSWQKVGVRDYYIGKFGRGSWN
jgi:GT2 family glycosyltransferase